MSDDNKCQCPSCPLESDAEVCRVLHARPRGGDCITIRAGDAICLSVECDDYGIFCLCVDHPHPGVHALELALHDVIPAVGIRSTTIDCPGVKYGCSCVCMDCMAGLITQAAAKAGIPMTDITVRWNGE